MNGTVTNRGLLRAALALALALFGLFLVWQFLAGIATAVLVLLVGLLLAVALSGPVEALHRRKVPRVIASISIVLGVLALVTLAGYLFVPVLIEHVWQLVVALPFAFSRIGEWFEQLAYGIGLPMLGDGSGPSLSTLISWGRRILGGALGLFGSLTTLAFGLVVAVFVPLYLTANPEPVVSWTVRLLPPGQRPRAWDVLQKARRGLLNWLKGRLLSMAAVGVLWTGALYLIGIPGALFLGLLAEGPVGLRERPNQPGAEVKRRRERIGHEGLPHATNGHQLARLPGREIFLAHRAAYSTACPSS